MRIDKAPFTFEIPGNPATKKNSPMLLKGRAVVLPSKAYRAYERHFRRELLLLENKFGGLPHFVGPVQLSAWYYLKDRAHYPDLNGLIQATQDILSDEYTRVNGRRVLTREWILADDRLIKSLDGCKIAGIDKDNPRVIITIFPLELIPEAETDPYLVRMARERMQGHLF